MSESDLEEMLAELRGLVGQMRNSLRPQPTAVKFEEAARMLSVSPAHIGRMVKRGELRVSNVGGARRIALTEIRRVLEQPSMPTTRPTLERPHYDAAAASAKLAALRKRR